MSVYRGLLASLVAAVLLSACNSKVYYPFEAESAYRPAPPGRWFVAPVDFFGGLRDLTDEDHEKVRSALLEVVRESGSQVVDIPRFERHWAIAKTVVGGYFDASTGLPNAEKLGRVLEHALEHAGHPDDIDLVLFPRVVRVSAEARGVRAHWDGVSRRISGAGHGMTITGSVQALSLHVTAHTPGGARVFVSRGGITLPQKMSGSAFTREFVLRDNLFPKHHDIVEGARVALHPLVPKSDY